MKSLVIANQKGGVGKTASSVHLAWYAAERGIRTAFIDLDQQGNASFTLEKYSSNISSAQFLLDKNISIDKPEGNLSLFYVDNDILDANNVPIETLVDVISNNLRKLEDTGYELVIFDNAPALDNKMTASLLVSQYVIIPFELETYSLLGLEKITTVIQNIQEYNDIEILGIYPSKVDTRNPRQKKHLEEVYREYDEFVQKTPIGLRTAIAESLTEKKPTWKINKKTANKAVKEIDLFCKTTLNKMGFNFR